MKVTNKSNKIIGIGDLTLLPGATNTVPAEFEGNPTVAFFVERGLLETVDGSDKKPVQASASNAELENALREAIAATEAAQKKAAEEAEARKEAEAKVAIETEARVKAEAAVKATEDAKVAAEAKSDTDAKAVEAAKSSKGSK